MVQIYLARAWLADGQLLACAARQGRLDGRRGTALLEKARTWRDPMYGVYVLTLALGLRREALGVRWADVDLDAEEIRIGWQLQRVKGELLHRQTKTDASDAVLPLVGPCTTALRARQKDQDSARGSAGSDGRKPPWSSPLVPAIRSNPASSTAVSPTPVIARRSGRCPSTSP